MRARGGRWGAGARGAWVAALCLLAAACGAAVETAPGTAGGGQPAPTPTPSPAPAPTPTPSPAPSPAPTPSPAPSPAPTPSPAPAPTPSPAGRTFYLSPSGNDAAAGTSTAAPWRTFGRAARELRAGDTLLVRGGRYESVFFQPVNSGTAAAPITIKAYPGERPVISGGPTYNVYFNILGKSWFVIDGLSFVDTTGGVLIYTIDATHVEVRNCVFTNHGGSDMISLGKGGFHRIRQNVFDTTGDPAGAGTGDHIYLRGSDYNLIEDNYFTRGGHYAIDLINYGSDASLVSEYNVVRNNTIEQHWGGGIGLIRGTRHTLVEGNLVLYAGEGTSYPKVGIQIASERNVVRNNRVVLAAASPGRQSGLALYAYTFSGILQHARGNRIYNNVVYKAGRSALAMNQKDASVNTGNKLVNNVFFFNRVGGPAEEYWPDGNYYLTVETYHAYAGNKWPSFPNGNAFLHNLILHADASGDHPDEDPLIYYDQESWGRSLAWVQASYPTWFRGNFSSNPRFVNAGGGDFRLAAGSPAIDAGTHLAVTTGAGSGTATVPVDDPYFFTDGFGVVPGDLVRVGTSPPARVVAVDYAAGTLRLDRSVSFAAGAPVDLPYAGSAPDVGLLE